MTEDEIRTLHRQGRGQETDFKPDNVSPPKLAETLIALANAGGGTVLLGLDARSGRVRGLRDPQASRDRALQAALLSEPPLIIPLPQPATLDGKEVLVITVPAGLPHVYSLNGQYLVRDGVHNRPLSPRRLRELMMARGELSFESLTPDDASLDDMDWERVERYLSSLEGLASSNAEEALHKRGCLAKGEKGYRPTYAGLLLFGREPQRFVHSSEIIAVRYAGREMSDQFVREDIRGPLPDQIRRAEAFLTGNMPRLARLTELEREEQPAYPFKAVREAIVNAVAHRDYSTRGEGIRIFLFNDRIEFYSPGRLPGHVTVANIVDERFSRNEVIVQVLADMGFIERLGYGIDRMVKLMRDHGLPAPIFQETANGFRVTLYGHEGTGAREEVDTSRWSHLDLRPRQEKALAYLAEHGRITNREYQELCPDVSAETIRRDLADLVRKNVLLKIGEKRATYYIFK